MFTLIDQLQETTDCYYIDFLPEKMNGSNYFEIEEFFYTTYIKDFSKKIVNNFISLYPVGEDIRNIPLTELDKLISHVIINDVSSVQIIFGDAEKSLISINGGFSIDIYNISEKELKLFNILIEQENLFLRKQESRA